jgi:hypothetical protein
MALLYTNFIDTHIAIRDLVSASRSASRTFCGFFQYEYIKKSEELFNKIINTYQVMLIHTVNVRSYYGEVLHALWCGSIWNIHCHLHAQYISHELQSVSNIVSFQLHGYPFQSSKTEQFLQNSGQYWQGPLCSHLALEMETVRIYEMSLIQPTSTWCHQPEAESTLVLILTWTEFI